MRLPNQHSIGHTAVTIVQALFAQGGCLSEIVQNDYGEDLAILPSQDGSADSFNIYVQVKGINFGNLRRKSIRIKGDHLRRWNDIITPVLLCVHDFSTGKTLVTNARRLHSRWAYANTQREGHLISLSTFDKLTKENVIRIIWECRFEYIERHMYIIIGEESDAVALGDKRRETEPADIHLYATETLSIIGIFQTDGNCAHLSADFIDLIYQNICDKSVAGIESAFLLSVVQWVAINLKISIGLTMLTWLTQAAGFWLKSLHLEVWNELGQKSPQEWSPYGLAEPIATPPPPPPASPTTAPDTAR